MFGVVWCLSILDVNIGDKVSVINVEKYIVVVMVNVNFENKCFKFFCRNVIGMNIVININVVVIMVNFICCVL